MRRAQEAAVFGREAVSPSYPRPDVPPPPLPPAAARTEAPRGRDREEAAEWPNGHIDSRKGKARHAVHAVHWPFIGLPARWHTRGDQSGAPGFEWCLLPTYRGKVGRSASLPGGPWTRGRGETASRPGGGGPPWSRD